MFPLRFHMLTVPVPNPKRETPEQEARRLERRKLALVCSSSYLEVTEEALREARAELVKSEIDGLTYQVDKQLDKLRALKHRVSRKHANITKRLEAIYGH